MPVAFEPFSPEHRAAPYSRYRALRDEAPVHYAPDAKVWCISRYEDVAAILNDPQTYSSEAMLSMLMNAGGDGRPRITWNSLRFVANMVFRARLHPKKFADARTLIAEDGDQHAEMRKIVNRGFTPRHIARLEPRIRTLAKECLSGLHGTESFDLVRNVAIPLPVTIISDMLGVAPEVRPAFKRWSDTIIETATTVEGRERRNRMEPDIAKTFVEMFSYLSRVAQQRRSAPADDLISTIVATQDGEAGLTNHDVVAFVVVLLVAGNETTTNLIGNAVNTLLDHPVQLKHLIAVPQSVAPALEEVLRFESPIQLVFRTTTRDVELHGTKIPKGACVAPLLGSANRDERQFPDPDRFDIERNTQGHLGFGFGQHFCLGSSLARLEARCALEALLPHLPELTRIDAKRTWLDSFLVRGPQQLTLQRRN